MAEAAAATVQAPAPAATPAPAAAPVVNRGAARAERRAAAIARIQADRAAEPAAAPAPIAETAKPADVPVAAAAAAAAAAPAPAAPEKPDPATERGLRAVEQARKKFLDEQNAAKAELDVQRAEIARLRKEAEGRVGSIDELKKLSPTELLERMDHWTDEDFDVVSRTSYARTKAGKADPRAQAAAADATRAQGSRTATSKLEAQYEELKSKYEALAGEFTRRDQMSYADRWVGEAVKAIPADKPTFIAKLHANEPETARRQLLTIGAELEKANGGEAPTHAEVVAEFEKRKRAELAALGLDADALLAPPKPAAAAAAAPAAKPAARTLDVAASNLTRPENAPKTREERRAQAIANLRARQRTTAEPT